MVYNKIMKIKKEGAGMRQEVRTVSSVVQDGKAYVYVPCPGFPVLL